MALGMRPTGLRLRLRLRLRLGNRDRLRLRLGSLRGDRRGLLLLCKRGRRARPPRRRRRGPWQRAGQRERVVDAADQVVEDAAEDRLGDGIARQRGRSGRERHAEGLAAGIDPSLAEGLSKRRRRRAQELARASERTGGGALWDRAAVRARLEGDVAEVHQPREDPEELPTVRRRDAHAAHRVECLLEGDCRPLGHGRRARPAGRALQVRILGRGQQLQRLAHRLVRPQELVEDVKVALARAWARGRVRGRVRGQGWGESGRGGSWAEPATEDARVCARPLTLRDDARLLEEVGAQGATGDLTGRAQVELDELAKPARVVVATAWGARAHARTGTGKQE